MRPTRFSAFPVPAVGGAPVVLEKDDDTELRALVRNNGTVAAQGLVLAFDSTSSLQPGIGSDVFNNIPFGQEDIFVVYPGQMLLAIGLAAATSAAVASSEAFPLSIPASR